MNKYLFKQLSKTDKLQVWNWRGKSVFVHNEHRFAAALPFLENQIQNYRLIMFDGHHDCGDISDEAKEVVRQLTFNSPLEDIFQFINKSLASNDGDWVKGSMELGVINDAIIFGVRYSLGVESPTTYIDHQSRNHKILFDMNLPGSMLEYQGSLSDLATRYKHQELWTLLNWENQPGEGFNFIELDSKLWVNIDLDTFIIIYEDFTLPWPDEVFRGIFDKTSQYPPTQNWSGKKFFQALIERADLISISREPTYCGGEIKCDEIFEKVNQYLFGGELNS